MAIGDVFGSSFVDATLSIGIGTYGRVLGVSLLVVYAAVQTTTALAGL